MSKTVLMVGTRKGCFLLESDESRRDWELRGPFCEGWPIYHAIRDAEQRRDLRGRRERVARREHLAQPGPRRDVAAVERGSQLRRDRAQALEGVGPDRRRTAAVRRRRDARSVREQRRRRDLVAPDARSRASREARVERPREPAAGPPRRPGDPPAPRRRVPVLGDRAGRRHLRDDRRRRVVDAPQPRAARRLAAREPRGRLLRPQARDVAGRQRPPLPAEPRRHAPQRRRRRVVDGDHRRPADRVRLRGRPRTRTIATRSTSSRSTPATGAACPTAARRCGARATPGSSWQRLADGLPQHDAHVGVLREGMAIDSYDEPGVYFGTSTGQLFASADEGESWSEIASYLPGITSVEVAVVD